MKKFGVLIFLIFAAGVLAALFVIVKYPYQLPSQLWRAKVAVGGEGADQAGKEVVVRTFPFSTATSLAEWDEKVFSGKSTQYSLESYQNKDCVKAVSFDSASALYYRERIPLEKETFVSWYWAPGEFPIRKAQEDLSEKDEYDFVAQVYVIFHASFYLNAKAIMYVWTADLPVGTVSVSPYTDNVKILVLQSGPSDGWKFEKRDVKKDYLELFGEPLKKDIMAISFMTDSDSTETQAVAYYSDITIGYVSDQVPEENNKNEVEK